NALRWHTNARVDVQEDPDTKEKVKIWIRFDDPAMVEIEATILEGNPALVGRLHRRRHAWPDSVSEHHDDAAERAMKARHDATTCIECGRSWDDETERWGAFLDVEDRTWLFCPACAEREF